MSTTITILRNDITRNLISKIEKMDNIDGFLNRVVYPEYQRLQILRFETSNTSEGNRWNRLKPSYATRKRRMYADQPYGGRVIGIATGTLLKSVVGPGSGHRKIVRNGTLTVSTSVAYAGYFDEIRSITFFNRTTTKGIRDNIVRYLRS